MLDCVSLCLLFSQKILQVHYWHATLCDWKLLLEATVQPVSTAAPKGWWLRWAGLPIPPPVALPSPETHSVDDRSISLQPCWRVPKAGTGHSRETRPQYLILFLTCQGKSSMDLQLVVCCRPIDIYFDPFPPGHSKVILEVWCMSPGPLPWAPGHSVIMFTTRLLCVAFQWEPQNVPPHSHCSYNCNNCHQLTICRLTHLTACRTNSIVWFGWILTACLWASRLPNKLLCCLSGVFPLSLSLSRSLSLSLCLFFKDFSFSLAESLLFRLALVYCFPQGLGETALACIWTAVHLCFHLWKGKVLSAGTLGRSTSCVNVCKCTCALLREGECINFHSLNTRVSLLLKWKLWFTKC